MNEFLQNPDFNSQDVFKKHKDFIFTNGNPMSGDTIKYYLIIQNVRELNYENIRY